MVGKYGPKDISRTMWEKLNADKHKSLVLDCDLIWKNSGLTVMIQVLSKLHIPVSTRSDVKVALHLVAIQTSKYPTAVCGASNPRCFCELLLLLLRQMIMHVQIIHLGKTLPNALIQLVHASLSILARPLCPTCSILAQQVASECAITSCILHVDVQVGAAHSNDDVEVDLHVMRDALLDGEGLCRCACEPARGFSPG